MDLGFTSHLITLPVVLADTVVTEAEIQSSLGFIDKGVINPGAVIGTPVIFAATQAFDDIISVSKLTVDGGKPVGIIATKPKFDSSIGKFRADIKLFGVILEGFSAAVIPLGTKVTFSNAPVNAKYQTPAIGITNQVGSQIQVVNARNPETGINIYSLYIPSLDVTNDVSRVLNADGTKPEKIKLEGE